MGEATVDKLEPREYNKGLEGGGELFLLSDDLAVVDDAAVTAQFILNKCHDTLVEIFWAFISIKVKAGEVKYVMFPVLK